MTLDRSPEFLTLEILLLLKHSGICRVQPVHIFGNIRRDPFRTHCIQPGVPRLYVTWSIVDVINENNLL